jgi:N-methylhydantoinase A
VAPARRRAVFNGEWREIDVWERSGLGVGSRLRGPAVVELTGSTLVVRPDWQATVDEVGTLNLERQR